MHENKFERQVGEKMDQLGFDPSDSVWTKVNQEINKEKRKRRPLFWIFFLSGLTLTGGLIYFVRPSHPLQNLANGKPEVSLSKIPPGIQKMNRESAKASTREPIQLVDSSQVVLKTSAENRSVGAVPVNPGIITGPRKPGKRESGAIVQQQSFSALPAESVLADQAGKAEENKGDKDRLVSKDSAALPVGQANIQSQASPVDSVSGLKTAKTETHTTKDSPWSFGITGSAGISNVDQGLFQTVNSAAYSYLPARSTPAGVTGAGVPANPAETHNGFSFSLGAQVNRKLSKRISLSAGLGYRYFSTTIKTGVQVDSLMNTYLVSGQTAAVNAFYRNGTGQEHTNQYQFIELPVNLNLQLNRSIRTPVIWQAGFSLAWMISSHALVYDPYTNVYFVNNQSFNTTQWNAATAFMIGFPLQNHSIQLGPQIQYALTGLLNAGVDPPGHLFFFGLKMTFIP